MAEWKEKVEVLSRRMDKLMKNKESIKPLERDERMRLIHAQLEISRL